MHHNYIERVHYVAQRDELLFSEQGMKTVRIYDPATIQKKREYMVSGTILCVEYITDWNIVAVSLSNRQIVFIDADDTHKVKDRTAEKRIHCPDSTLSMVYVPRNYCLFTGGLTGALYAWNMQTLVSGSYYKYDPSVPSSYTMFLVPGLPWFQTHEISLMLDIPSLDVLSVGYSDGGIRIWSLKAF